jgi:DNA mismatch repair protein MutS
VFLHRVAAGAADKSWGVHVARMAGVPTPVIDRARDLLIGFEMAAGPGSTATKPRRRTDAGDQLPLFQ